MSQVYRLLIFDRKYSCRLDRHFDPGAASQTKGKTDPRRLGVNLANFRRAALPAAPEAAAAASAGANADASVLSTEESMQLIMGMCYSIKNMLGKMSPASGAQRGETAFSYRTSKYRLHYYEPASGWKFVMLLSRDAASPITSCVYAGSTVTLENALKTFYATVFLDWVIKNPLVVWERGETLGGGGGGGFGGRMEEFFTLAIFAI